jgi:hypothetical protein
MFKNKKCQSNKYIYIYILMGSMPSEARSKKIVYFGNIIWEDIVEDIVGNII